jgi:hypothetical protein
MIIDWTSEKEKQVLDLIEGYIFKHRVTAGESVMQMDGPQIDAPQLLAEIVDVLKPEFESDDFINI